MSNTSTVTPYSQRNAPANSAGSEACAAAAEAAVNMGIGVATGLGIAVVATTKGMVSLLDWLYEEYKSGQRTRQARAVTVAHSPDAVHQVSMPSAQSIELNLRRVDSLLRAAETLGYQSERPAVQAAPDSPILLVGARGERMALQQGTDGRIVVHTAGGESRVQALVRKHTADRVVEHFRQQGMPVQIDQAPSGEVQVRTRETDPPQGGGGAATISATVRTDGRLLIDVENIRGRRCEKIVDNIARAVGGQVTGARKKPAYNQLPGPAVRSGQVKL